MPATGALLLFSALLLPAAALAGVLDQAPGVLERIEVEGNRRTTAAHVRRTLGLVPGEPVDLAALPALEQRLLNEDVLRSVRITPEPGAAGVVLRVAVEEKWTLVPVPVLGASDGAFIAGLVVFESNFLGAAKRLGGGFIGSNLGASAFAVYRDPAVAGSRWLALVRASAADERRERFVRRSLQYRFRDRRLELQALGGRRLDDRWSVFAGWLERREESVAAPGYAPPPRAGPVHGPALALELEAADVDDYLRRGVQGRAQVSQGLHLGGRDREVRQASAQAVWSGRAARDHSLSLAVLLDHVRGDPDLDAVLLGGATGSRGFESQGLWAEDVARAALEYQIPVWRPRAVVVTAAGFLDLGLSPWRGRETDYAAPGLGLRVYLRNVAIPVLGFDVAWANGQRSPAFSVQLGLRR